MAAPTAESSAVATERATDATLVAQKAARWAAKSAGALLLVRKMVALTETRMAASSVTATARMTVSAQEMAALMETAMAKGLVKPKDPAMAEGWERRMAVGSAPKMAVGWAASSALDLVTVSLSAADSVQ